MTAALRRSDEQPTPTRPIVRPAPPREPPFDDELPTGHAPSVSRFDQRLPFEIASELPRRPAAPIRFGPLPEPASWTRRLIIALTETAAGQRPLQQIVPLLSPAVHQGIGADLGRWTDARHAHWLRRARVRSVRASEPTPGVTEVCATVEVGPRVRAIAIRLEDHRGHWRCTRLQLG